MGVWALGAPAGLGQGERSQLAPRKKEVSHEVVGGGGFEAKMGRFEFEKPPALSWTCSGGCPLPVVNKIR